MYVYIRACPRACFPSSRFFPHHPSHRLAHTLREPMADEKIEPATDHRDAMAAERRGNLAHIDLNKNLDAK